MHSLWDLWLRFFQIGLFSIGGGYATIPLIREQIVDRAGWLSLGEFADVVTISQMTPGPLAVNASTFVGIRLAGIPGAAVATLGCVVSGVVIALCLGAFFAGRRENGPALAVLDSLKAASVGLIAAAAATILAMSLFGGQRPALSFSRIDLAAALVFAAALLLLRLGKINPILLMAATGGAGFLLYG